jgi:hypothetical protein
MSSTVKIPLYGHNSFESAYLVEDYPYGRLRCKIWFWLEYKKNKGYRFCSRTENPKNGRLNAPKYGTYHIVGACMYLDEIGHVQYAAINEYSDAKKILDFVTSFPNAECNQTSVKEWCLLKRDYELKCMSLGKTPYGPMDDKRKQESADAVFAYVESLQLIG